MNIDERFSTPNHRAQLSYASPSRLLHGEDDIIISNGYHQASFHPPVTRKVTKVMPSEWFLSLLSTLRRSSDVCHRIEENYSLSNGRPNSTRSASTASLTREVKETRSTTQDAQRLKKVRRHEPAQIQSGSGLFCCFSSFGFSQDFIQDWSHRNLGELIQLWSKLHQQNRNPWQNQKKSLWSKRRQWNYRNRKWIVRNANEVPADQNRPRHRQLKSNHHRNVINNRRRRRIVRSTCLFQYFRGTTARRETIIEEVHWTETSKTWRRPD